MICNTISKLSMKQGEMTNITKFMPGNCAFLLYYLLVVKFPDFTHLFLKIFSFFFGIKKACCKFSHFAARSLLFFYFITLRVRLSFAEEMFPGYPSALISSGSV